MGIKILGGQKIKAISQHGVKSQVNALEVGFFGGARYSQNNMPVAMIAAINEFGAAHIPERPFFRNANALLKLNYLKFMQAKLERVDGLLTLTSNVAALLGLYHEGLIQRSIEQTLTPANAPATIARKKSSHPLIDTGYMLQSVTYKVS